MIKIETEDFSYYKAEQNNVKIMFFTNKNKNNQFVDYSVNQNNQSTYNLIHQIIQKPLIIFNQVHGNNCATDLSITAPYLQKIDTSKAAILHRSQLQSVDSAILTKKTNYAIAVYSADCVPILIYDAKNKTICCIHAGWKSAVDNIIQNNLTTLLQYCEPNDISVYFGPCIHQKSYEVKQDFYNLFINKNKHNSKYFLHIKNNIYFDIVSYCKDIFGSFNINNLTNLNIDTFTSEEFVSYRKIINTNKKDIRFLSLITL